MNEERLAEIEAKAKSGCEGHGGEIPGEATQYCDCFDQDALDLIAEVRRLRAAPVIDAFLEAEEVTEVVPIPLEEVADASHPLWEPSALREDEQAWIEDSKRCQGCGHLWVFHMVHGCDCGCP